MTSPRLIVGAGLAGLIAAHAWPGCPIMEASPKPQQSHRALLRFRSDAVARLTGVEFKKVRVHKGIWSRGSYAPSCIALANLYARKCLGTLSGDRSIWSLDPVDRFIAPDDFYAQLLGNVGSRVEWAHAVNWPQISRGSIGLPPVVSTAPIVEVLRGLDLPDIEAKLGFVRAPIHVLRFDVPDADVYQTVYFPDVDTRLYRASITGRTLICEFAGAAPEANDLWHAQIDAAFGLKGHPWFVPIEEGVAQRYGKIAPIDDAARRSLLFKLTYTHGIFSLGRFATWRNLLLDDVVDDIAVVKRLLRTADSYELRRSA